MKKRLLAALLCVAMTASLLVGCGDGSTTGSQKESESTKDTGKEDTGKEDSEKPGDDVKLEATPKVHYTFDSTDEAWDAVVRNADTSQNIAYDLAAAGGGTYGIVAGDKSKLQVVEGAVGKCVYLNGTNALNLKLEPTNTDAYSVSFWTWATRITNFGPTLTMGTNMGYKDNSGNNVAWLNVTQVDWPGAMTYPAVWSRNEAHDSAEGTDSWPWMCGWDLEAGGYDATSKTQQWVMVTIVVEGDTVTSPVTATPTAAVKYYVNGELMYDSADNSENGTYCEYSWDYTLAASLMKPAEGTTFESYFGINYWDVVYKGCVDDFYLFDSAISANDVKALYAMGDPTNVPTPDTSLDVEDPALKENPKPLLNGVAAVGKNDFTQGWWSTWSDIWEVKEGQTATVKYENYHTNVGFSNYHNSAIILQNTPTGHSADATNDNYAEGYKEYIVARLDNYAWAGDVNTNTEGQTLCVNKGTWDFDTVNAFKDATHDSDVVLTVTNNGSTADVVFTVTAKDGTVNTQEYKNIPIDGPLYFCLTVEKACINITELPQ